MGKNIRQMANMKRQKGLLQDMVFPFRTMQVTFARTHSLGRHPSRQQQPSPVVSKASSRKAVIRCRIYFPGTGQNRMISPTARSSGLVPVTITRSRP